MAEDADQRASRATERSDLERAALDRRLGELLRRRTDEEGPDAPLPTALAEAWADAAVDQALGPAPAMHRPARVLGRLAAAALAAVALGFVVSRPGHRVRVGPTLQAPPFRGPPRRDVGSVQLTTGRETRASLTAAGGKVQQLTATARRRLAVSRGDMIIVQRGRVRLRLGRDALELTGTGGQLRFERLTPNATVLRLMRGRLVARVAHRRPGQRLRVQTMHLTVTVVGTRFTVVAAPRSSTVEVTEGQVLVTRPGASPVRLPAGRSLTWPAPAVRPVPRIRPNPRVAPPRQPVATVRARDLLREASAARARADWTAVASAYSRFLTRHRDHPRAPEIRVALATLLLQHLRAPARSLRHSQRYLQHHPRGSLALEARVALIEALRQLGRTAAEAQAIRDLLRMFPGAIQAASARQRLRALEQHERHTPAPGSHRP